MLRDDQLALIVAGVAAIAALAAFRVFHSMRHSRLAGAARTAVERVPAAIAAGPDPDTGTAAAAPAIPFADAAIELLTLGVYRLAFGTASFNYAILGEHQTVMERVRRALPLAATNREYFPRKPLV